MGYLLLAVILLPLVELVLLIKLGQYLGALNTVLLVILTGVAGALLAKYQGWKVLWEFRSLLAQGIIPGRKILEGVLVLAGGILLLTPGLITDTLGFLFLLPPTRQFFVQLALKMLEEYLRSGRLKIYRF
ncbi:MAG: FxsA family protein [Clostridia bacterium]|nr:FxsA family protein [Clostridia bacterium]